MIQAQVSVSSSMIYQMGEDGINRYVHSELAKMLTQENMKNMTISTRSDPLSDSVVYTATVPVTHTSANSITLGTSSNYNGTFTNNHSNVIIKNPELRVMEYTKNGKVTRVELQYYDGENWIKVPRHTLEE